MVALDSERPCERPRFFLRRSAGSARRRSKLCSMRTPGSRGGDELDEQLERPPVGIGSQFGAFRLIEKIGEGGMGAVFRAERTDGAFTQEVAVKVMRSTIVDRTSCTASKSNVRSSRRSGIPNIVTLLDGGATPDGQAYLVMEFVDGAEIVRHCRDKALSLRERLHLFRTLCTAVQYAHQHGVVHRDLKPANILIGSNGVLKVLDFGVAKLLRIRLTAP